MGKVSGKLTGTVGLFVSMSGFSPDAVNALVAGKELNLILMDGDDVRAVARGDIGIASAIQRKLRAAAEAGTPFVPLEAFQFPMTAPLNTDRELILVEGRFDERIVSALIKGWGTRASSQSVVPVGGAANFAPSAEALLTQFERTPRFIVIADGDGQPEAARQRIANDLTNRLADIPAELFIIDSTLEVALGLFTPSEFASGRRKVLSLSEQLLLSKIDAGIESLDAVRADEVSKLFSLLGIERPRNQV